MLPLNIVDIYTLLERMQHVVAGAFAMWSKRGTAALAARTAARGNTPVTMTLDIEAIDPRSCYGVPKMNTPATNGNMLLCRERRRREAILLAETAEGNQR